MRHHAHTTALGYPPLTLLHRFIPSAGVAALEERLNFVEKHLEGTQFSWERMSESSILVTDPEGQQYTVQDAAAVGHSWPFDLAIKEIRLPAHVGSSEAIAHLYRTLFGVGAAPRLGTCIRAAEQEWDLSAEMQLPLNL